MNRQPYHIEREERDESESSVRRRIYRDAAHARTLERKLARRAKQWTRESREEGI